jgi:hypothetical protein
MRKFKILAIVLFGIQVLTLAQDSSSTLIPPSPPTCDDFSDVAPIARLGGNTTLSLGGLSLIDSYFDQTRDANELFLEGEIQDFLNPQQINLTGCFVDESEFHLFGAWGNAEVLLIGMVNEGDDFSDPSYGGIWYRWDRGYSAEADPDDKGFFFDLGF